MLKFPSVLQRRGRPEYSWQGNTPTIWGFKPGETNKTGAGIPRLLLPGLSLKQFLPRRLMCRCIRRNTARLTRNPRPAVRKVTSMTGKPFASQCLCEERRFIAHLQRWRREEFLKEPMCSSIVVHSVLDSKILFCLLFRQYREWKKRIPGHDDMFFCLIWPSHPPSTTST